MKLRFFTADVFTDIPFRGNRTALVLDAARLSTDSMQTVAAEFGFAVAINWVR